MSNLDSLPFDICFELLAYLELGDIVRLGKTCKQLNSILHEATLCRRAVEVRRTTFFASAFALELSRREWEHKTCVGCCSLSLANEVVPAQPGVTSRFAPKSGSAGLYHLVGLDTRTSTLNGSPQIKHQQVDAQLDSASEDQVLTRLLPGVCKFLSRGSTGSKRPNFIRDCSSTNSF